MQKLICLFMLTMQPLQYKEIISQTFKTFQITGYMETGFRKVREKHFILSINEKLPLTRVHLTQEHIWIFLDRELPSVQLLFLWCTVLWIGTTENGVRHTWMHDTLSLMNTRCFYWILWELAKWRWFLKVWAAHALFDGIIKTISMAFSKNIFRHTLACLFLKIMFSHFDKPRKAQNERAAAAL